VYDQALTRRALLLGATAPVPAATPRSPSPQRKPPDPAKVQANELGTVPVMMYHRLTSKPGEYDMTPGTFRAQVRRLLHSGYRPINARDLARGQVDVPAGTTPVVPTFDDGSPGQFALRADGRPEHHGPAVRRGSPPLPARPYRFLAGDVVRVRHHAAGRRQPQLVNVRHRLPPARCSPHPRHLLARQEPPGHLLMTLERFSLHLSSRCRRSGRTDAVGAISSGMLSG